MAVDLRGHGKSDKPRQSYTMRSFADDVAWMCCQLKVPEQINATVERFLSVWLPD